MKKLDKEQMLKINGGTTISSAFISTLTRAGNVLLEIGRSLGTAIRRIYEGNPCSLE